MLRQRARFLSILVAAGTLAAGCSNAPSGRGPSHVERIPLPPDTMLCAEGEVGGYGGRFVIAATAAPKTFNPLLANETPSSDVTDRLFAGLADYDNANQRDTPSLARSWETSPDGLVWTFHLRRGACFSDGHPITSGDVLFNFTAAYDSLLHPSVQDLLLVDGRRLDVTAPDSYTVVVRTPHPNPLLVARVSALRILPRHILEPVYRAGRFQEAYNTSTPPESIVCSGPWRIRPWSG